MVPELVEGRTQSMTRQSAKRGSQETATAPRACTERSRSGRRGDCIEVSKVSLSSVNRSRRKSNQSGRVDKYKPNKYMNFKKLFKSIWKYRWMLRNLSSTIYFNFHYLPLKQAIHLPIWLYKPHLVKCCGSVEINPMGGGKIRHDSTWREQSFNLPQ